jgi:hypothetical protein
MGCLLRLRQRAYGQSCAYAEAQLMKKNRDRVIKLEKCGYRL